jgi:hypothetical protein
MLHSEVTERTVRTTDKGQMTKYVEECGLGIFYYSIEVLKK